MSKTKKKGSISPNVVSAITENLPLDSFIVYPEPNSSLAISALEGYEIANDSTILKIPIKLAQKLLMPYRHIEKITLAIDKISVPDGMRLRLNVTQKYAERGIILLEELPWLINEPKQISIGHVGKQIIEICNGDHLFVGWLEESFPLE